MDREDEASIVLSLYAKIPFCDNGVPYSWKATSQVFKPYMSRPRSPKHISLGSLAVKHKGDDTLEMLWIHPLVICDNEQSASWFPLLNVFPLLPVGLRMRIIKAMPGLVWISRTVEEWPAMEAANKDILLVLT